MQEPLTLDRIARIAHLEPTHLSHFFREKVGMTFTDWLAAQRIERAVTLLSEHDYSIEQVAIAVGFRNRRTCERWFRRFIGVGIIGVWRPVPAFGQPD